MFSKNICQTGPKYLRKVSIWYQTGDVNSQQAYLQFHNKHPQMINDSGFFSHANVEANTKICSYASFNRKMINKGLLIDASRKINDSTVLSTAFEATKTSTNKAIPKKLLHNIEHKQCLLFQANIKYLGNDSPSTHL